MYVMEYRMTSYILSLLKTEKKMTWNVNLGKKLNLSNVVSTILKAIFDESYMMLVKWWVIYWFNESLYQIMTNQKIQISPFGVNKWLRFII